LLSKLAVRKWGLKILPEYFEAIQSRIKSFEIRENDRNFKVGDFVILQEYIDGQYTGKERMVEISYITDYKQRENHIVFAFK
jgi:hypothetical protein